MFAFVIFTLGYLLGGITALIVLGLTVAARYGDRGRTTSVPHVPPEDTVAAWHRKR